MKYTKALNDNLDAAGNIKTQNNNAHNRIKFESNICKSQSAARQKKKWMQ